jgi:hypothetical protein
MPSTCTRKSYGGARNVKAYANRLMRKKYPDYYAKKNINNAGFKNMVGMANGMASVNKQQANAVANAAMNASKAADTVEAAINNAKNKNKNFWNTLSFGSNKKVNNSTVKNAAQTAVTAVNNAANKAQNMAKLANNAAKIAANAAKVANSLRAAAAAGGSRRKRRTRRRRN